MDLETGFHPVSEVFFWHEMNDLKANLNKFPYNVLGYRVVHGHH